MIPPAVPTTAPTIVDLLLLAVGTDDEVTVTVASGGADETDVGDIVLEGIDPTPLTLEGLKLPPEELAICEFRSWRSIYTAGLTLR